MLSNIIYRGHALRIAFGITALTSLLLAGGAGAATLTVNASGGADYVKIQDAIDNASAGDTILVYSGTYFENVNVTKRLTLRGIGMPIVDARGIDSAIKLSANGINLEGFTATNGSYSSAGLFVNSNSNIIKNNNVSNNMLYGIYLFYSSNNTLSGNIASNNDIIWYHTFASNSNGIKLVFSSNNTLTGNIASNNNGYGIYLFDSSSNNTLSGNNASNNVYGIYLDSNNNTLSNNNASNNKLNGIGLYGTLLDSSTSSNNLLTGNIASNNNGDGINIGSSNNNVLIGNNASNNNDMGINIGFSNNNTLSSNIASNNDYDGINLFDISNSTLTGNIVSNNRRNGIELSYGIIDYTGVGGQYVFLYSSNNTISDNIVSNNNVGISLSNFSNNNTLSNNNVSNNNNSGISLDNSSNNTLINNFFNNKNNFAISGVDSNIWNSTKTLGTNIIGGPYLGGNFWANPSGTGFSQTCTDNNSDGICDSPYALDSNNTDYLPLAIPQPMQTFNISGFKINDTNGNGIWDAGEMGIENWNIELSNGTTGALIDSKSTDVTGFYEFMNLTPGNYTVTEEMKPGFIATNVTSKTILIENMDIMNVNFTNQPAIPQVTGSISGFKINDTNGNGRWDACEAGLSGWKITLRGIGVENQHINKETVTDATGFYEFDNLSAGRYIVTEKFQKGFVPTSRPVKVIILSKGENSMNNNFTNRPKHGLIGTSRDVEDNEDSD